MKTTPTSAGEQAERGEEQVLARWCTVNAGRCRNGELPSAARPITLAVTEASTTMPKDSAVKSRRISSIAKNTPASGALKVAAMPPAAPQATSTRIRDSATRTSRPSVEPSAEPICTIGPSRPTDPPPPMHSAEASALTAATWGAIRPPRRATANITSGTPCPRASRAKKCTSGPYNSPATTGASITNQRPSHGRCGLAACPAAE